MVVFENVVIGPLENAGYGPPSKLLKVSTLTVGILSSISLPREDVRIVDPGAAALVQAALGEDVDEHVVARVA